MKGFIQEMRYLEANTKGKFFLMCFRVSNFFSKTLILRFIGFPFRLGYTLVFNYILGIDVPDTVTIGTALNIYHGQGLVVNSSVKIGNFVTLRHNTTIGNAVENGGCPIIEDNVNVGANVVIIGAIRIGENSIIAAGSVVIKDVPANTLVAGNPAIIKKYINEDINNSSKS